MKIFSIIKIAVMTAALFCFSSIAMADLKADTEILCSKLKAIPIIEQDGWDKFSVYRPNPNTHIIVAEHNTAAHDYFKLYWNVYFFQVTDTEMGPIVNTTIKKYTDFCDVSGRGLEVYAIEDYGADGIPDSWMKDFLISVERNNTYYFLAPKYPNGFIDMDWYQMTNDEVTEKYQEVVNYFLNLLHNTGD